MRKPIIVSAEYGQCIYSGHLRIAAITNFCLQICGNRGKKLRKCEIAYPPVTPFRHLMTVFRDWTRVYNLRFLCCVFSSFFFRQLILSLFILYWWPVGRLSMQSKFVSCSFCFCFLMDHHWNCNRYSIWGDSRVAGDFRFSTSDKNSELFTQRTQLHNMRKLRFWIGGASTVNFSSLWLEVFKSTLKLPLKYRVMI